MWSLLTPDSPPADMLTSLMSRQTADLDPLLVTHEMDSQVVLMSGLITV